jgi:tetratricopeptide (TPR) repeat protein
MATLRCKQNRQADAAELLEELATLAPPHPATFINLGTVYNQLKQYDKAEVWFKQAINLKGGEPEREDLWYLGICKKNQGKFSEGLDLLQQALELFLIHEPDHPVTLAKLHSSVGGCLHDMGRAEEARDQFQKAYDLYVQSVGKRSPLFCSAAEGLAKALKECNQLEDSFDALVEAFDVHATQDAVHPTPLFENLEMALQLHDMNESLALKRMVPFIRAGIANLDSRGMAADGNAGLVMSRGAKLIKRVIKSASGNEARELTDEAGRLLSTGKELLRASHEAGEADIMHEVLEAEMMLKSLDTAAS